MPTRSRRGRRPAAAAPPPEQERAPSVTHRAGRGSARLALVAVAVAGLAAVAALAVAGAGGGSPPPAVEAVTDTEVRVAVKQFSDAYASEDPRALGRVLTADVVRVLPSGRQQGRRAVVAEYAKQFDTMNITAYTVSDLQARGGDAGRAEGNYTVRRKSAAPFGGHLVLGVVKEHGRVRIRLIAATPT